ncbi:Histidinol dehydrogenase [Alkalibacterium sp. AK22]|uniref:histidinol dehydrogenase n=1 Tax=Alkalibacterium sp. AK22 TaxID=1229520 RepID=UPI000447058A|nr:histidinol dehydrogenase [Alkalibacterium sp. AK22]EXJ22934.1 Histidinol dehydrogenase [Alkalibacterium sp. AK22]
MYTTQSFKDKFKDLNSVDWTKTQSVMDIIQTVQQEQDAALRTYSERFDHVTIDQLEIPSSQFDVALSSIDEDLKAAMQAAHDNIQAYQQSIKLTDGLEGELFQKVHPLSRVGIYVPGGTAPLLSTVLMTAVLAKVAGVGEIIVTTPPQADGIHPAILAACSIAGVDRVFQVGGAQAVAALAYGTESIPKVDKIVGPGNQYVALAKKLVYGDVGIDSIAGPSEIVVAVDETTDARWAAFDILAQAEHDIEARTFLVSTDKQKLEEIYTHVQKELKNQPRADIIRKSLSDHHYSILTESTEENMEIINLIAGEHVSIQTKDAQNYVDRITTAGALFVGSYAPEAIGDYVAGPSHVLPTGGTSRFSNGLTVNDFLRTNSVIALEKNSFLNMAKSGMRMAKEEELQAHHDSMACRMEDLS